MVHQKITFCDHNIHSDQAAFKNEYFLSSFIFMYLTSATKTVSTYMCFVEYKYNIWNFECYKSHYFSHNFISAYWTLSSTHKKVLKTKIILSYSFNLVITICRKDSLTF